MREFVPLPSADHVLPFQRATEVAGWSPQMPKLPAT